MLSLSFYYVHKLGKKHSQAVGIFSVSQVVIKYKEATYFCWIFPADKDSVVW
jgi:hypothetical protein